jgi:hypothetical protein
MPLAALCQEQVLVNFEPVMFLEGIMSVLHLMYSFLQRIKLYP